MKVRSYGQWLGVTQEYKGKKHYQTFVVSSYDHSKTNKKCRNICCNRTKRGAQLLFVSALVAKIQSKVCSSARNYFNQSTSRIWFKNPGA